LFLELDFVKGVHADERSRLDRTSTRQSKQPPSLQNPAPHPEHWIEIHVRCHYSVQQVLHAASGERQRLDDSPTRPLLRHEKQFETFPGPVNAILNAGLLYCSEQLARRTDARRIPMTRHTIPRQHYAQICASNVEIEYHGKHRTVNIQIAPVDLRETFNKSRPSFPHKRHHLEKHKIEHKFEVKTAVLHILLSFSFSKKPNRDPPSSGFPKN
jgi:hypothetical protein